MAYLNGYYIFVETEDLDRQVDTSTHSVEQGVDITDTVKRKPLQLSLSGSIVEYEKSKKQVKAATIIKEFEQMMNTGKLITFNGRNYCANMQIQSFPTTHTNNNTGGADFTMSLQECRIVKNAYVPPIIHLGTYSFNGGKQQVEKGENEEVWHTVKKGDCVAALVAEPNAPYKNLKREGAKSGYWGACNWVMDKNQSAFSRKGDFRTLQIGKKILLGTR